MAALIALNSRGLCRRLIMLSNSLIGIMNL